MIALGLRYLTGYAAAMDASKQTPEWPPHPGRVFMALAAAHFETGADPGERKVLEWLEAQGAPRMRAGSSHDRTMVRAYVPVNDEAKGIWNRPRQDRSFARTRLDDDRVYLVWDSTPDGEQLDALARVCAKVTRVGHSISAVQMWIEDNPEEIRANLIPRNRGAHALRVASIGTLDSLESAYNETERAHYQELVESLEAAKGKAKATLKAALAERFPQGEPAWRRPTLTGWAAYGNPPKSAEASVIDGPFDSDFLVLTKVEGPVLGLETTTPLTGALRDTAIKRAGDRTLEWLSGHTLDERPTTQPHAVFFPLPFVGDTYADGHVVGLGIAWPRTVSPREAGAVLAKLLLRDGRREDLELGVRGRWTWKLELEDRETPPKSLRRETWTGPACVWASVTPVVFSRYPRKNRDGDAERLAMREYVLAGYPEPEEVWIDAASQFQGAGAARDIPVYSEGGTEQCRYHTHVRARFAAPIRGPMFVGRGRFRGYGLMRPLRAVSA